MTLDHRSEASAPPLAAPCIRPSNNTDMSIQKLPSLVLDVVGTVGALAMALLSASIHAEPVQDEVEQPLAVFAGVVRRAPATASKSDTPACPLPTPEVALLCLPTPKSGTPGIEYGRAPGWVQVAIPGSHPLDVVFGWLRESDWSRQSTPTRTSASSWTGVWQNSDAKLNIKLESGRLHVDGHAIHPGINGPNFGSALFDGLPVDGVLRSQGAPDDCRILLQRVGEFILGQDNGQCGGLNVTFNGVYRFRRPL
jgi:hypothetical protein